MVCENQDMPAQRPTDQTLARLDAEIAQIVRERRDLPEESLADVASRFGIKLDSL